MSYLLQSVSASSRAYSLVKMVTILPIFAAHIAIACPEIDQSVKDFDGMPFCPSLVETSSAYAVFGCAINQATSFHSPTVTEKKNMVALLSAFKNSTANGISKATTQALLASASALDLQACRVKQVSAGVPDSYLLIYTKPGVTNYSGPFLMLRETNASRVIIVGPHDDSDNTYAATKLGLSETHALATISNGHNRSKVAGKGADRRGPAGGDFVHTTDNLGTFTVSMMGNLFPKSVWLHAHGMSIPDKVLVRSRSSVLQNVFEAGIVKYSKIEPSDFKKFNADFTIDSLANSSYYLKTEIPAIVYRNNKMILAGVVKEIEKRSFAWTGESDADDSTPDDSDENGVDFNDGESSD